MALSRAHTFTEAQQLTIQFENIKNMYLAKG